MKISKFRAGALLRYVGETQEYVYLLVNKEEHVSHWFGHRPPFASLTWKCVMQDGTFAYVPVALLEQEQDLYESLI